VSLWSNFVDNIAKPVGAHAQKYGAILANAYSTLMPSFDPRQGYRPGAAQTAITKAKISGEGYNPQTLYSLAAEEIEKNAPFKVKDISRSDDLVLRAGTFIHDKIISPFITRPTSTLGLLLDRDSALYTSEENERGFQPVKDLARAWRRSEDISWAQAWTKSDIGPLAPLARVVFAEGANIDLDDVDLWNDEDVQRTFRDNTVGAWFTGTIDFFGTEFGILGAFKLGKFGANKVNINARNKSSSKMEQDIDEGLEFSRSGGAAGRETTVGRDVEIMATSQNPNLVYQYFNKYSNNENLLGPITRATNPATVRDIILADKGYLPALDRLSKNAPADLYEIADVGSKIRSSWIENDGVLDFSDTAWERMNAAFDDAIARVPEYRALRDALLDPSTGTPLMLGKKYLPFQPVIGSAKYIAAREKVMRFRAATTTREFSQLGRFEERILGGSLNGPLTRVIRFTGTYKPLYNVTIGGPRPFDGIVELNAFFDSMKLFRNGRNDISVGPDKTMKAAEYRDSIMAEYINADTPIAKSNVLQKLDDQLGVIIANTNGFFDTAKIKGFTQELKNKVFNSVNSVAEKGYGMEYDGVRVIAGNALTQRQLVNSYRLAPWDVIENEIIKATKSRVYASADVGARVVNNVYETFNKWWTFNVLATPKYISKQSIFEPSVSATLALGSAKVIQNVPTMTTNSIGNNLNRFKSGLAAITDSKARKAIDTTVSELARTLNKAVRVLDDLTAEASAFLDGSRSPATVKDNLAKVNGDLRAAHRLVDAIELELRDAVRPLEQQYFKAGKEVPFSKQVPSIANLERRLDFIENNFTGPQKAKIGSDIANARSAIAESKASINTLVPNGPDLLKKNKEIAKQYAIIEQRIADLGDATVKRAEVYQKNAEYGKRYYGSEQQYRMVEDQWVPIKSLFDENEFGAILRKEFGNTRTATLTYVGDLHEGVRQGMIMRRGPQTVTRISDPNYYDELAFVINRYFRQDPLIELILQNSSEAKLYQWIKTNEGRAYINQFGDFTDAQIPTFIQDRVGLVNRYIPNAGVRQTISKGEVNPNQLALALAEEFKQGRLSPIHPVDFNYQVTGEMGRTGGFAAIEEGTARYSNWIFQKLVGVENPIRQYVGEQFFYDIVARKANELAEQGYKIGPDNLDRLNSLRASATAEALQQVEKSFYTVRRQNRALYAMRLATAFPTATLNAFYRYGRFALQQPRRTSQFLYAYQSAFRSYGVDQYGNNVEDPLDSEYLLVPLTKQLGFFDGKGVRLSARSIGFLLNFFGPSIWGSVATGKIMEQYPDVEDVLKNNFGNMYETLFPFGPQESIAKGLTPIWAADLFKWLNGPKGQKDFLASWNSVHNYYKTLDDLGIQDYPGSDKIYEETKKMWGQKFRWNFASPFGVPAQPNTRPFSIYEDLYNIYVNKYKSQGLNDDQAKEEAEKEFIGKFGPDFPLDNITFKGSSAEAYIQPTVESKRRVFVDSPALTEKLADLDPKLVGLLSADLDYNKEDFNLSVYRILQDPKTRLPGDKILNKVRLTPDQVEKQRQVNRIWEQYYLITDQLTEKAYERDQKSLRSHPDLLEIREELANTVLKEQDIGWWREWKKGERGDNSYLYAQALTDIVNDKKWMRRNGNTLFWKDVEQFLSVRSIYTSTRESLEDRDPRKSALRAGYEKQIEVLLPTWHPKLQSMITRFFENDTMKVVDK
jgi:hypothetical protein